MQYVKAYILGGMNKLMNKRQILILSVLSILTATLALCMWAAGLFDTAVPAGGSEAPVWETVREARPSLNENIVWENRLGGTGEESLVAAFTYADRILVFGNTDSTDYDFSAGQGLRGFIAVLDEAGTTQTFYETDRITAVTLHEQGFLLALYAPARAAAHRLLARHGQRNAAVQYAGRARARHIPLEDGYTVVTADQRDRFGRRFAARRRVRRGFSQTVLPASRPVGQDSLHRRIRLRGQNGRRGQLRLRCGAMHVAHRTGRRQPALL